MIFLKHRKERKQVAETMRRLYLRGLTTASGGNVSLRIGNIVIITPSQTDKGIIKASEIAIVTIDSKNITPHLKPSMELQMHLNIYKIRSDIKAIVHSHPPIATALSAKEGLLQTDITGEIRAVIGTPVFSEYHTMGTKELADEIANKSKLGNVILMQHHGIIAVGRNMIQAFDRIEVIENCAKMVLTRKIYGITDKINTSQLNKIDEMFKYY